MNLTSRVFPELPRGCIPARCKNRTDPAVCGFVDLAGHGFRVIQVATAVDMLVFGCGEVIVSVDAILSRHPPDEESKDVVEEGLRRPALDRVQELGQKLEILNRIDIGFADKTAGAAGGRQGGIPASRGAYGQDVAVDSVAFGEFATQLRTVLGKVEELLDAIRRKRCGDVVIALKALSDRAGEIDDILRDLQDLQKKVVLWPAEAARGTIFSGVPAPDAPQFEAFLRSQVEKLAMESRLWAAADLA